MNFWIKTICNEKITRNTVVRNQLPYNDDNIIQLLQEICHQFDIPTPIVTKYHFDNLDNFNFIKFVANDFIESIDFDYLLVECFG